MSTKKLARKLGLIRTRSEHSAGAKRKSGSKQLFSYLIVIDFESTCWREKNNYGQEIIEFPAVFMNTTSGEIESEFHSFVQPQEHPVLSTFCTELTGITQKQVEAGIPLRICLSRFTRWLQDLQREKGVVFVTESKSPTASTNLCTFVTWSDWDLGVCLLYECKRKQISKPVVLNSWIDLRATYRGFYSRKPKGLSGALQDLGIEFSGREHSGLDDARNTAYLVWRMIADGCVMKVTKSLSRLQPTCRQRNVYTGSNTEERTANRERKSSTASVCETVGSGPSSVCETVGSGPSSVCETVGSGPASVCETVGSGPASVCETVGSGPLSVCQSLVSPRTVLMSLTSPVCVNTPQLGLTLCQSTSNMTATTSTFDLTHDPSPSNMTSYPETPDPVWPGGFLLTEVGESGSYDDVLLEDEPTDTGKKVHSYGVPRLPSVLHSVHTHTANDTHTPSRAQSACCPESGGVSVTVSHSITDFAGHSLPLNTDMPRPSGPHPSKPHPSGQQLSKSHASGPHPSKPHPSRPSSSFAHPPPHLDPYKILTHRGLSKTTTPSIPFTIYRDQSNRSSEQTRTSVGGSFHLPFSVLSSAVNKSTNSCSVNQSDHLCSDTQPARSSVNQSALASCSVNQSAPSNNARKQSSSSLCSAPSSSSTKRWSLPPCRGRAKITSPLCDCGRRAKRLTVCNGGPNHGRAFFTCTVRQSGAAGATPHRGCGFFKWESALLKSSSAGQTTVTLSSTLTRPVSRTFR